MYVRIYYKKKDIYFTKTILKFWKHIGYFACMYLIATVRFNVEILKRVTRAKTHFCAIKYMLIIN